RTVLPSDVQARFRFQRPAMMPSPQRRNSPRSRSYLPAKTDAGCGMRDDRPILYPASCILHRASRTPRPASRLAFTILELMLAIGIFAMVLTAIYMTWI